MTQKPSELHYYLDMDDVLFDFSGSLLKLHHQETSPLVLLPDGGIDLLAMSGCATRAEMLEPVASLGSFFWENLPLLPWAHTLVDFLNAHCPHRWSLASDPGLGVFPWAMGGKTMALEFHFSGYRSVFLGKHKYELAREGTCLIDDLQQNVHDFSQHGGRAIHFYRTWIAGEDPLPLVLAAIR